MRIFRLLTNDKARVVPIILTMLVLGYLSACGSSPRNDLVGPSRRSTQTANPPAPPAPPATVVLTTTVTPGYVPTPCPVLPTYLLWWNGILNPSPGGNWMGKTSFYLNTRAIITSGPGDNLNGGSATMTVWPNNPINGPSACGYSPGSFSIATCPCGSYYSSCAQTYSAPSYSVCGGMIAFDIMLATAPGNLQSIQVQYGKSANCINWVLVDPSDISTLSFTEIKIPLTQFKTDCGVNPGGGDVIAFEIGANWVTPPMGPAFHIGNIRWTGI